MRAQLGLVRPATSAAVLHPTNKSTYFGIKLRGTPHAKRGAGVDLLLAKSEWHHLLAGMERGRVGEGGRKGGVINQIVTGPNHAAALACLPAELRSLPACLVRCSMLNAKEAFDIASSSPLHSSPGDEFD